MFCSNCGAKLPEGTAFCGNCGTAQNQPVSPPKAKKSDITITMPVAAKPPAQKETAAPSPLPPKKKSYKGGIITLIAVLVVAGLGGTGWFLYDNGTLSGLFEGDSASSQEKEEDATPSSKEKPVSSTPSENEPNGQVSSVISTVESAPPTTYAFEKGTIVGGVYTNKWVNLQYDTTKLPEAFTIEIPAQSSVDFQIHNASQDRVAIEFFNNPPANLTTYFDQIFQNTVNYHSQQKTGYRVTSSAMADITLAGESYKMLTLVLSSANGSYVEQRCCRVLDNRLVEITIVANNTSETDAYRSVFQPAR